MSTEIYLGNPPENIKKWIKENYKPVFNSSPLCFTAEQANSTVKMSIQGSAPTVYLETSPTGEEGSWSDFTVGSTKITLANVGDKVYFRAKQDNERFATSGSNYNRFVMTGKIAASGNLNTLLKADGSVLDLTTNDIDRRYCYSSMFYNCASLTKAPELPATTLADHCYSYMFYDCKSLTQAPELSATTLADYCYSNMFYGCASLTKAPELPATTLANDCYINMFFGCTFLTQAPSVLPATTLATGCYERMFYGCKSLTQAPSVLPATTLAERCYTYMFNGCTSLTQAPELPATTLADYCYTSMFSVCTSLTQAPELPATTLAEGCYDSMFYNCTSLTQAPSKLPATTLTNNCYYMMFNGCTSLTQAPELPATTLADKCYEYMFKKCTSLTQAPNIAKIYTDTCYGMFYNANKLEEITFTDMTINEVVNLAKYTCIGIPNKQLVICYCTDGVVVINGDSDSSGSGS